MLLFSQLEMVCLETSSSLAHIITVKPIVQAGGKTLLLFFV
ncbi:hypothetical protein C806_03571 [Lachnospiraceae bacterium 3-1]|nr:hypothetical protein C806_03571 [Lachnospiraceae bacterium 3-1]